MSFGYLVGWRRAGLAVGAVALAAVASGCGWGWGEAQSPASTGGRSGALPVSMALLQVGDIPAKGNDFERAVEAYTNTRLNIQWIPLAAYDDKINVMLASNEMPKITKVNYVPTIISAAQSGQFWEIGPYLSEFKNLSAQNPQYYANISIEGRLYGIPNFRDIGRAAIIYRKDWFDSLGLKLPVTLDDWYNVMKAMATRDPDKNGKNDTFGTVLYKKYNEGTQSVLTRIAVSQGAPNRWGVQDGKFTPEFVTEPYMNVLKLFRKLYAEKLINTDFAAFDLSEADKLMDNGRAGMKLGGVAQNGKSFQDRLDRLVPGGVYDIANFEGPGGVRIAGEPGNFGFLVFPKSSVRSEGELRQLLGFLDKMMDVPMETLQLRGVEGKHYVKAEDGKVKYIDFDLFQKEVKPYRDNWVNVEGYNVPPLADTPIGGKGTSMARDNSKYAVPNPALTLTSPTYSERGKELDELIWDAQTKYIMGKIDDAGWQSEVANWRKAGGDSVIAEYEASYARFGGAKK